MIASLHADLVSQKISCTDLITKHLTQATLNTHNATISILHHQALDAAALVDAKIARGEEIGLLEGIPFGVKDTFMVRGTPTTGGSRILQSYLSPYTATAVQDLLDAGAICIAKENCDAFGHGSSTANSHYGVTHNAHIPGGVAGGSSGGSAVNVADRTTIFSLGEDTGGSIRQPAGYNRVYGFKPSYGTISRYGCIAYASSLDTIGPIASSMEDISILMSHLGHSDPHDMTSHSRCDFDQIDMKTSLVGLRVGYYRSWIDSPACDATIRTAFERNLTILEEAGAIIVPLEFFPDEILVSTYYVIAMAQTASNLSRIDGVKYGHRSEHYTDMLELYMNSRGEGFSPETQRRIVGGNQILASGYLDQLYTQAMQIRGDICQHFADDFGRVDCIISPTTPNLVPQIGASTIDPLAEYLSDIYTVGFSLGGIPTVTIPASMPTGLQISSALYTDTSLLEYATSLDRLLS